MKRFATFLSLPNIRAWLAPYLPLIRKRFAELVFINPAKSEITLGLLTLAFGLYFLTPAVSFDRPPYSFLASVASENVWAFSLIFLGLGALTALFFDRFWERRALSLVLACTWAFLAAAYFTYDGYVELGLVAVLEAVSAAWTFFQVGWKHWRSHA